jgi:hypothetical protein
MKGMFGGKEDKHQKREEIRTTRSFKILKLYQVL